MNHNTQMGKKDKISDDDINAFRDAVRGIQPLINTKIQPTPKRVKKPKTQKSLPEYPHSPFSDHESLALVTSEDIIEYHQPGIQHKTLRNLRTGQYNVEGILDLHGKTVDKANEALHHFLLQCKQEKARHVLIIHGKGRDPSNPILKNKLNHWLRQTNQVLAFCSATNKDGRTGALYVLLKYQSGEV
ncbi:MAG: Smr/MutS family protein [Gammaproteobacteria bacterium]|nr:Smr/MutS family protein [Gammaproteobacteria bacterium]